MRKCMSKKIRFEVFKRDSFTCQYCGSSAPSVILEVDHIIPVASGGKNEIMNLVTACMDCNRGKGKRHIDESSEIEKQKKQLDEINQKRQQLELMMQWKNEMGKLEEDEIDKMEVMFSDATNHTFSDKGRLTVKKLIKKYGFIHVYETIEYLLEDNFARHKDAKRVFDALKNTCEYRKKINENPMLKDVYYIRGILKNKGYSFQEWGVFNKLEALSRKIDDPDEMQEIVDAAKCEPSYYKFREFMLLRYRVEL